MYKIKHCRLIKVTFKTFCEWIKPRTELQCIKIDIKSISDSSKKLLHRSQPLNFVP